ncbi:DUF7446 family protein [Yersinia enterocolitica]|uniref:DUF7446 family protein n=1 Tax=Yersinia TaxID=629 RepID=UPI0005E35331|nr:MULTISPECIES: hypothetical protein [Yersinia]QKJ12212.1 hypothetical protein HRD68_16630 [Yersinia massiliensis]CNH96827.1 Uncharacterised protein [Yersinia intermedia]
MKIKTMGASPLTGTIFQGTLDTAKGVWVGKKEDVTEQAVKAVAEHMKIKGQNFAFGINNGKYLIMTHKIVDVLPDEFKNSLTPAT